MKAVICEDERIFSDDLKMRTEKFFISHDENISFDIFTDGEALISEYLKGSRYDIVFLDIQLENSSGMEAAVKLREIDKSVPIIFVTGLEDYAADGYSVNAFDYIVKSSVDSKLEGVLERLLRSMEHERLAVEDTDGRITVIPINEILYVESDGRRSVIHSERVSVRSNLPIGKLSKMLTEDFIEIYRSIYVCAAKIKSISADTLELTDGTILPVGRRRRKELLSAVMRLVKNI